MENLTYNRFPSGKHFLQETKQLTQSDSNIGGETETVSIYKMNKDEN